MDPITDLFLTTQVASVVHARLEATAPWDLKREAKRIRTASPNAEVLDRGSIPISSGQGIRTLLFQQARRSSSVRSAVIGSTRPELLATRLIRA